MERERRKAIEKLLDEYGLSAKRRRLLQSMIRSEDAGERQLGAILRDAAERDDDMRQSRVRYEEASIKTFSILAVIWVLGGLVVGMAAMGAILELPDDSWWLLPLSVVPFVLSWMLITLLLWLFHRRRCQAIQDHYLDCVEFAVAPTAEKFRIVDKRLAAMRAEEGRQRSHGSKSD